MNGTPAPRHTRFRSARPRYDQTMHANPARPVITAGPAALTLEPAAGGRIAALAVDGIGLLRASGPSTVTWGCYPMVPWAGRLRDGILAWNGAQYRLPTHLAPPHALHGTALERAWDLVQLDERSATMAVDLAPEWPFGGRAVHFVSLEPDRLHATLTVEAAGAEFPAVVGWHPWFTRQLLTASGAPLGSRAEVHLPAGGMLLRGADYLPTGTIVRPVPAGPWDDCFVELSGAPAVRWPGAMEVDIESDAPYWVCYTEPPDALCVEPQTGPPNGLNTGDHALVAPGRPLVASMTLRWRTLP
jgi:aldose 1-epimerase